MTEVKDADEAIRILGNTAASNWFDNVYAGYDKFGDIADHETSQPTNIKGYREATVVVFNRVQKDNNNEMTLRVKNDVTTNYGITFEDQDGTEIMSDVFGYRGEFPNNYVDKLDVAKCTNNNATGIKFETIIDHSETKDFPIVKVTEIDGRKVRVEDVNGDTARLYLASDAKIFLRKDFKEGALIQFRNVKPDGRVNEATEMNRIDTVSVMPAGIGLKGSLQDVVLANQGNQAYAKNVKAADIKEYNAHVGHYKVILNQLNSFYDADNGVKRDLVWMSKSEAEALQVWLGNNGDTANIRYKLKDKVQGNENEAYDLEVLMGDKWYLVADANKKQADDAAKKAQKDALDAFDKKVAAVEDATKLADQAAFDKAAKALQDLVSEFNALKVDKLEKSDVDKVKANLNTKIKALNDAAAAKSITTNPAVAEIK